MAWHKRNRGGSFKSPAAIVSTAEQLEDRQLLAAFGNAWADPRGISISFPAENTPVGSAKNNIRTTLDAVAPRLEWQTTILRAAQSWAENANINIGLVPDRSDSFGAVGLATNDPRFGEIRIGAFPQKNVIASAVANLPISGTWGGDILLDSTQTWSVANANSQHATTGTNAQSLAGTADLYTIALHELGHSLSIGESTGTGPVMTPTYTGPRSYLTAADIAAVQAVYGVRQDPFETTANNTVATATPLTFNSSATSAARLQVPGSLKDSSDIDVYSFQTLPGKTSATVTLWAAGISLLDSEIEVRTSGGTRLDLQRAESIFRNNVRISLNQLAAGETYFVTVRKNNNTAFSVGDYRLDLDFRSPSQLASVIPVPHDADPYTVKRRVANTESAAILQALSSTLVDPESTQNETPASATALTTALGFTLNTQYEAVASLSSAADRDFYTIKAPAVVGGVLNVDLAPLGATPVSAELYVMNSAGDRLAARMIKNADGTIQLQVQQPVASETYLICVRSTPNATATSGNYVLTANFSTAAAQMTTVLQSSVILGQRRTVLLTSNKSQLFRIDLGAGAGADRQGLQLNLIDAATGESVKAVGVIAGATGSMFVWLPAGEYYLVTTGITCDRSAMPALSFTLKVDVISDDEGPGPDDGTSLPIPEEDPYITTIQPESDPAVGFGEFTEDPWSNILLVNIIEQFVTTLFGP
ncbi:MAG: matrixin family metalloprotease [Planctomycetota bacterium]